MPSFRLDRDPWIPVVFVDGTESRVNLVQVFSDATKIAAVVGSPLESVALMRFLLAIVHLVRTPTSYDEWSAIWGNFASLMYHCAEYVASHGRELDLFDEKHPFGQAPNLGRTSNPAHLLVYEAARKNNATLASHCIEGAPIRICGADLACGLIVTNSFAGSSGGGYRSGPLAMRTVAMLSGACLAHSLVLNLLVQPRAPSAYDWRYYGNQTPSELDIVRRYLWASRRIRLEADGSAVGSRRMMLAPGDEMPEVERAEDPMVVMRKDSKGKGYVPLRLASGRALWRSAHVLLDWHDGIKRLAVVDQLHKLLHRELIPMDQEISMRVCGVAGDAKGPTSDLWRDEKLPFGLSVVLDDERYSQLVRAVTESDDAARVARRRIYAFAARYLQNGTGTSPDSKDIVLLSDELAPDLAVFWSALAPVGERIACDGFDEAAWSTHLRYARDEAIQRAVQRLPANARRYRAEFAHSSSSQKGASA